MERNRPWRVAGLSGSFLPTVVKAVSPTFGVGSGCMVRCAGSSSRKSMKERDEQACVSRWMAR